MKTILFVSPTGTLDNGAEVSIFNLMKDLVNQGHRVINVAPVVEKIRENDYSKIFEANKIDCHLIYSLRWWWEDAPGHLFGTEIERANSFREVIFQINQLIETNNVDLVVTNTVNMFVGATAAAISNVPHYWLIHEFPENEFAYYKNKIDFIDHYSTEIFAVSGNLQKRIAELFPEREIHSFIPYSDIVSQELDRGTAHRIVSVGRINRPKNQLELIKAYEQLNRTDIELVFIGGHEETYKQECMNYIKEHQIKNISFLGNIPNPWQKLTTKDICVFSSTMETFGLVYVEALLNGLPVILSDNPGHLSSYQLFEKGKLYERGNISELTKSIQFLLDNFDEQKQEAVEFVNEAKKRYNVTVAYKHFCELAEKSSKSNQNSLYEIKNILMLNEPKSKLAKLEYKTRTNLQKIKYRVFKN